MKKYISLILSLALIIPCMFALVGCGGTLSKQEYSDAMDSAYDTMNTSGAVSAMEQAIGDINVTAEGYADINISSGTAKTQIEYVKKLLKQFKDTINEADFELTNDTIKFETSIGVAPLALNFTNVMKLAYENDQIVGAMAISGGLDVDDTVAELQDITTCFYINFTLDYDKEAKTVGNFEFKTYMTVASVVDFSIQFVYVAENQAFKANVGGGIAADDNTAKTALQTEALNFINSDAVEKQYSFDLDIIASIVMGN